MTRFFLPLLCLLTVSVMAQPYKVPAFTDSDRAAKIQALAPAIETLNRDWATKNHFPGLTFGVVVDGQLVLSGGTGFTDVAKKIPATTKSVFRIASMTKSVTGVAILKLRDAGKLQLDDPISRYIPEAKNLAYLTTDAAAITVRDLLTHAGGFPEDNPWGDRQLADSDADLLALIKNGLSNANAPGETYEYSNLGFAMLGRIITVVSGKSYQQYITDEILKPLGMTHT
ncbi:MAG: beta-lactamase family protein, partial [Rudanella sp.]|nr:beta-lactamase family protein [Rudanella sp.]